MEVKLSPELTEEEIKFYSDKAEELARKHTVSKVHPVVQINPETFERTVCFLREPNYLTKVTVMDKGIKLGIVYAADELREIITLKEESDAITYSDSPESDAYKLGVTNYCISMVKALHNQFKKK